MKRLTLLFIFCVLCISCSRFHNAPNASTDARYVVISPIYNEIIWALGAQDKVVGIDLSTTYPPEVKNVQTVGYHRALSAEGILSLHPTAIVIVALSTIVGSIVALRYAKQLNALMIGEDEATYLGVNVNRLKWVILSVNVVIVAVATAFTGVISFVGLVVPHILRMIGGADNRFLIPGSALMGATLLTLADLMARLVVRPAELPIGIVTSAVGVPVFIFLLRRRQYIF